MINRRTKILATLGPSTDNPEVLKGILDAGVNVVRINFSHNNEKEHLERIAQIRKYEKENDIFIGILMDLQGPKIRISAFKGGKIELNNGDHFALDAELDDSEGNQDSVGIAYKELPNDLNVGNTLLLDDGKIILEVKQINGQKIFTEVKQGGILSNNKGINLRGGGLSASALTNKDKKDIIIAAKADADYVAISFQASRNETYERITGFDFREKLYSNIKRLRDMLEKTILGARCVINKHNYTEVDMIYNDAKQLGIDYLIFIPAVDYEKRGDVELNTEEKNYLRDKVEDIMPYLDDSFTNLGRIMNQGVSYYKNHEKSEFSCYANQIRATAFVNYDGGVWLCQPHIGKSKYCIGNINKHSFTEIWNSGRHCEVIELLDEEHKRGDCRNCRSIAYNEVLHNYILTGRGTAFYDPFL